MGGSTRLDALTRFCTRLRFDTLDAKIDQRFLWMVGVVVSTWLTAIGAIFRHHSGHPEPSVYRAKPARVESE